MKEESTRIIAHFGLHGLCAAMGIPPERKFLDWQGKLVAISLCQIVAAIRTQALH